MRGVGSHPALTLQSPYGLVVRGVISSRAFYFVAKMQSEGQTNIGILWRRSNDLSAWQASMFPREGAGVIDNKRVGFHFLDVLIPLCKA